MAKLSNPQAVALVGIHYHGAAVESRQNTIDSLFNGGLVEWGTESAAQVTMKGYQAYEALTGVNLLAPSVNEIPATVAAPGFNLDGSRQYDTITEPKTQADGPTKGRFVVNPVPVKIGSMNPGPTFVERPNTVHGGHTVAQVDRLIEDYRRHGLTDDEISERLDTWHLKANRSDRRAQVHARKVRNRLDMRSARSPKRRRYVSPEAVDQKARVIQEKIDQAAYLVDA